MVVSVWVLFGATRLSRPHVRGTCLSGPLHHVCDPFRSGGHDKRAPPRGS